MLERRTVDCELSTVNCVFSRNYGQAERAIRTSQLSRLLDLHTWPIDVVVFDGPSKESHAHSTRALILGRSDLGAGFTLRCIQRLSMLNIATERYGWRHNSYTRGQSIPVLSY